MPDESVSALVVVRPPSGRLRGDEQITADTVQQYVPAPATLSALREYFKAKGFSLEASGGLGFSITGTRGLFERVFGTRLIEKRKGASRALRTKQGRLELPVAKLPREIASHIQAVTFTRPPDFGPTSFDR